jgi:hypothetical protein
MAFAPPPFHLHIYWRLTCCATALFVEVPHPSISWIYASIGCQHTLQPTTDDFSPPSIPALTTKGFVRWQSIEILLGPEEHVPFIQTAVRNFAIKNPDNGEAFPVDLPKEAFPLKPDSEIERWHQQCAEKLRQRATPTEEDIRPDLPPRPKVQASYTHVRPLRTRETDYFEQKRPTRPLSYTHVSSAGRPVRPKLSRSPNHRESQFLAPEDNSSPRSPASRLSRSRRRSFPENLNTSPISSPQTTQPDLHVPPDAEHPRRHSHPRQARRGSYSSDASSSEDGEGPPSPRSPDSGRKRRPRMPHAQTTQNGVPGVRYTIPPSPSGPGPLPTPPEPRLRPNPRDREEELKRMSFPIPIDLTGKLSAPFLLGKRAAPRSSSGNRNGNVRWKDLSAGRELWGNGQNGNGNGNGRNSSSQEDMSGSGRKEEGRYKRQERERDLRPKLGERRRSSNEDVIRRERDREREREREREMFGRGGGSGSAPDSRSFRERDRERRGGSPVRGVDGRRYPGR